MRYRSTVICLVFVCFYRANGLTDDANNTNTGTVTDTKLRNNTERTGRLLQKECHTIFSIKCIKIHLLSFLEDLSARDELALLPGLSIVKENTSTSDDSPEEMAAELSRQFPGKSEEKLNQYLMYRLRSYLDGHSLKYKLLDQETVKETMEMNKGDAAEGRRRGGGGGGLGLGGGGKGGGNGGLLAAALMTKGALAAAALGALGLLAGKALMASLISLLLSAIIGLKSHGESKSSGHYEIVAKPSYSHEEQYDHGHHGSYKRAYDVAYNSYAPYINANSN